METIDCNFNTASRATVYRLYPIGDVHIGALNCAERELMALVSRIAKDPNAYWVGGGDLLDCVVLQDKKRFDVKSLPNWMVEGKADDIKQRVGDIVTAQKKRFLKIVGPIKHKCLGLIEGNHEESISKHHNRDIQQELCEALDVPNLTDCAVLRMRFKRETSTSGCTVLTVFISHGHGGGRSAGAEPNKLKAMMSDKDVDILLMGHSHSFHILPPVALLYLPHGGKLLPEPMVREKFAANWGSYMFTYKKGPATYASRANYPVKPMYTVELLITPHTENVVYLDDTERTRVCISAPNIEMRQLKL